MGDEKKILSRGPVAAAAAVYGPLDGSNGYNPENITPLNMDIEWDPYVRRKQHGVGLQPMVRVMRDDRTPLNTPYTPQLMKLHLTRLEAYDERDEYVERPGKQLVTMVKSKLVLVLQPVYKIRCVSLLHSKSRIYCMLSELVLYDHNGDVLREMLSSAMVSRLVNMAVPRFIQDTAPIVKVRPWIVWYFTAVICIPFVMMLSPLLIAFSVCTSPIWIAGVIVLLARLLLRKHHPIGDGFRRESEEEEREEGGTSLHHPNSVYRRAHLTNSCNQRGCG